jgi:hypothetical protein
MDQIEKGIKRILLKVAGMYREPEELANETTLDDLGLNDMFGELAVRFRTYLQIHNANQTIDNLDLYADLPVGDVVQLLKGKLQSCNYVQTS